MARIEVTRDLLQEMLFAWSANPVTIQSITTSNGGLSYEIDIAGADVPVAERVHGIINQQQNRAGERLRTLTFEPIV